MKKHLLHTRLYLATLLATVLAVGTPLPSKAQTDTGRERLAASVRNAEAFTRLLPQEKVYLHLDNTGYFLGERIWYKAYVVRPDTAAFTNLSRVLYVELVDPFGEILETQKLKIENGQCHGDISLEKPRATGFYEIRAYTRYMTNWPAENIFSRVVPVFARPQQEGDYSRMEIQEDFVSFRTGSDEDDADGKAKSHRRNNGPQVSFYPEGGQLVQGLTSTVAFSITIPDSTDVHAEGELRTASGEVLEQVRTLREGRGTFLCTPTDEPLVLALQFGDGREHTFPLPKAEEEGCALTVNAVAARQVGVQVTASPALEGSELGLSLIHNGNVLAFQVLTMSTEEPVMLSFPRNELPAGVHQLTLFDAEGRIWAQRHFFIPPRDLPRVEASFTDSIIAPCQRLTLQLQATASSPQAAGATVSLAVRDAETTTNDFKGNAATYLLLSSDLRGFVRDADYYFEADDNAHRQGADLLCLVQGWTRYDWAQMAGEQSFDGQQPLEDGLYIDGILKPRSKGQDVAGVPLDLFLSGELSGNFRGTTQTDADGKFAFSVPECLGDHTLLLSTKNNEDKKEPHITLNRLFSPARRTYDIGETRLLKAPMPAFVFKAKGNETEEGAPRQSDGQWTAGETHELGEAVVKRKKRPWDATRKDWEVTRRGAEKKSQFYFNMERAADEFADRGLEIPTLCAWLLSKEVFSKAFFEEKRGIGWLYGEASRASYSLPGKDEKVYLTRQQDVTLQKLDREQNPSGETLLYASYSYDESAMRDEGEMSVVAQTDENLTQRERDEQELDASTRNEMNKHRFMNRDVMYNGLWYDGKCIYVSNPRAETAYYTGGAPAVHIDELREVYVSLNHDESHYTRIPERAFLSSHDPFHVFVYPYYQRPDTKRKGVRRTHFQGYNVPHSFEMPDYAVLPPEKDYRRTLYWNPSVQLDAKGHATVDFYNNSSCQSITVSVEGVTTSAMPIVLR
ncbi:MAG: hypothetical protein IJ692_06400 [Alloprevotella sp.]|nr:hypothetical protein [Alloprevotella sp.]